MVRKIIAVLAGFVTANLIIILVQLVGGLIYGMPKIEGRDTPALAAYVASMPTAAKLLVLFGYALGYVVAGYLMRKISKSNWIVLPGILGLLGTIGWTLNLAQIPHPIWMAVVGYLCFSPFTLLGHVLASPASDASQPA